MQLTAIIVSLTLTVVGAALFARATVQFARYFRLGQSIPPGSRTNDPMARTVTVLREFLGHTRMNRWGIVGVAHWFVAIGFFTLGLTILTAYCQLFQADFVLPILGGWLPYEVYTEFIALGTTVGVLVLIVIRQLNRPGGAGRKSRFTGSKMGQAYFVEAVIVIIGLAIMTLRGLEGAFHHVDQYEAAYFASYPLVVAFRDLDFGTLQNLTYIAAMVKLGTTMIWAITISLNTNMGVAWHRFLGFPNIWFKRNADGAVALGALLP
ncbi:Fe-S oxidoreductase, partial [Streptomyces sp. NPDC020884]